MPIQIPKHVEQWIEDLQRESYQKGWDDATEALLEAAAKKRPGGAKTAVPAATEPSIEVPSVSSLDREIIEMLANASNRERVMFALQARPGMRPVEVVRFLESIVAVKENSILTTIKRMRRDGEVQTRGNELYLHRVAREAA